MTTRVSSAFAAAILGPQSFEQIFRYACIEVYSGSQPDSADLPPTGTLLGRVTRDGSAWDPGQPTGGLEFTRVDRMAVQAAGHVWVFRGLASGTAGWCRLRANNDASTCIDGSVAQEDAVGDNQMFLADTAITPATTARVRSWWYAIPPIGV